MIRGVAWGLLALVLLVGCSPASDTSTTAENGVWDTLRPRFAQRFFIRRQGDVSQVVIRYPGKADSLLWLTVVPDSLSAGQWPNAVIRAPRRIVSLSAVHWAFLDTLGATPSIVAVDNAARIYNPRLRARAAAGQVQSVGGYQADQLERLLALRPDIVLADGYADPASDRSERLVAAGIARLPNLEWQEDHPLGRAEWIKVYGEIVGKPDQAQATFDSIAAHYDTLRQRVRRSIWRPVVMTGRNYRGTWYVPGAQSYVARLIRDAGCAYVHRDDAGTGSIPKTPEQVLAAAAEADIWINMDELDSRQAMLAEDERYRLFRPFREGRLYNKLLRQTPEGGNDYFERALLRADLVLGDLIFCTQPARLPDWHPVFYRKLD